VLVHCGRHSAVCNCAHSSLKEIERAAYLENTHTPTLGIYTTINYTSYAILETSCIAEMPAGFDELWNGCYQTYN